MLTLSFISLHSFFVLVRFMSLLTSWKSGLQAFGKSTNIVAAAASSALSMIPSRDATTSTKWNKVSKVMQKKHAKKNLTRGRNGGLSATSLYPEFSLAEFTKYVSTAAVFASLSLHADNIASPHLSAHRPLTYCLLFFLRLLFQFPDGQGRPPLFHRRLHMISLLLSC